MSIVDFPSVDELVSFHPNHRPIFATETWGVLLHRNQTYLGRSIVYLRTRSISDLLELSHDERDALWDDVIPRLETALRGAFQPDRLNYAHLANRTRHVHWHVVPRYETVPERHFAGKRFLDDREGMIFRTKRRGKVGNQTREAIVGEILAHLPRD
jgi:diadenosine tetraphosphate (Ap4A) HIT family hydrolase